LGIGCSTSLGKVPPRGLEEILKMWYNELVRLKEFNYITETLSPKITDDQLFEALKDRERRWIFPK